jgi:hypothetical protein
LVFAALPWRVGFADRLARRFAGDLGGHGAIGQADAQGDARLAIGALMAESSAALSGRLTLSRATLGFFELRSDLFDAKVVGVGRRRCA